jgi:hypothetical protein
MMRPFYIYTRAPSYRVARATCSATSIYIYTFLLSQLWRLQLEHSLVFRTIDQYICVGCQLSCPSTPRLTVRFCPEALRPWTGAATELGWDENGCQGVSWDGRTACEARIGATVHVVYTNWPGGFKIVTGWGLRFAFGALFESFSAQ